MKEYTCDCATDQVEQQLGCSLQVAEDIWVCDKGTIKPWTKDIRAYKAKLAKTMKSQN